MVVVRAFPYFFLQSLSTLLYFLFDNYIWITKVQLIKGDSAKASQRSGFFWFLSLLFQIAVDLLSYYRVQMDHVKLLTAPAVDAAAAKKLDDKVSCSLLFPFSFGCLFFRLLGTIFLCVLVLTQHLQRTALHLSLLKTVCDVPIAGNAAFKGTLTPRVTGALGLVSSLVGLYQVCAALPAPKKA